jgi:metal-responsive CopG/Arc/MetJ family transcriptional regulator
MERTTIVLPENLRKQARRAAAERGVSMSQLIREALEEKLRSERPKPKSIGIGYSPLSDISEKAGEIEYEPDPWR